MLAIPQCILGGYQVDIHEQSGKSNMAGKMAAIIPKNVTFQPIGQELPVIPLFQLNLPLEIRYVQ